ncbi:Uncharacterized protein DBV15_09302 [Temnothorax longispinosus]|uniref:Uncharacterized protein n=1 Tax=Temnothorax longispinosus TaxID=300112 RepID=A0A4V3SAX4_9HYME|nr:Uncharacterized protein DBV15_09302 [Temnothorax longispinosus]
MIPAGSRDHSTTTTTRTAVTRRIVFPAAVTGVAADTWNVTGDVARGVASRRKAVEVAFSSVARYRAAGAERKKSRGATETLSAPPPPRRRAGFETLFPDLKTCRSVSTCQKFRRKVVVRPKRNLTFWNRTSARGYI